jgi:ABC-type branched-subunit amino acid transport system permease subunit
MSTIAILAFDGIAYGMILFLISVGLSLTMGLMGFANLAHGTFAMAGGYVAVTAIKLLGVPFLLSLPIAFVVVGAVSMLFERLLYRRLYAASELDQVLMTFGVVLMSVSVTVQVWGPFAQPVVIPDYLGGRVDFGFRAFPVYRIFLIAVSVALVVLLWVGLERTRWGAQIRAAVDNRRMAQSVGINVDRLFVLTFGLGSGLAALGGALGSELLPLTPGYALEYLIYVLIVVSVGGLGSIRGAFVAALVIGILDTIGKYVATDYGAFFMYAITLAVLMWRPAGLFGRMAARPAEVAVAPDSVFAGRWRPLEALPWIAALAAFFLFDRNLALGAQVLIAILFALSLDLVLGYAGILTLGHAAFFGIGAYTAGMLSAHLGIADPLLGLAAGVAAAAAFAALSGWVFLRTHGLTVLMLTLAFNVMLFEVANKANDLTGGTDGLQGVTVDPLFGLFRFDLYGKLGYLYTLAALFLAFLLVRGVVYSPFGLVLRGIRENTRRMHAVGTPVHASLVVVYTIGGALAGLAGVLSAQTTKLVALDVVSFERAGFVLVMLILGGAGRMYGAFLGALVYMLLEHYVSKASPEWWYFWIGLLLVLRTLYARRGLFGALEDLGRRIIAGRERRPRPLPVAPGS